MDSRFFLVFNPLPLMHGEGQLVANELEMNITTELQPTLLLINH